MTKKIITQLICDACESEHLAERSVDFSLERIGGDRFDYEIELCHRHLQEFDRALEHWAELTGDHRSVSAKLSTNNHRKPARRDPEQLEGIRIWGRARGFDIPPKGRIPSEVEEAYNRRSG